MEKRRAGRSKLSIATTLAVAGTAMILLGLFVGRGLPQGFGLVQVRLALLVLGFCLAIAGAIGLAAIARDARPGAGGADGDIPKRGR
jgi:hypothetical protein